MFRKQIFRRAVEKGVKIIFGTDIGGPPWAETGTREFSLVVNWGMMPMLAIQSVTLAGATVWRSHFTTGATIRLCRVT